MLNYPVKQRTRSQITLHPESSTDLFSSWCKSRSKKQLHQQSTLNQSSNTLIEKVIPKQSYIISQYKKILSSNLLNIIINPPSSNHPSPSETTQQHPKQAKKFEQCEQKELLKHITPPDSDPCPVACELMSYKFLYDLNQLKPLPIQIPDTFVYGHGFDSPTFIFTENKQLKFIQKLNLKAVDLILKIFNKHRVVQPRVTSPIAVLRTFNSVCNKVIMRNCDFKAEFKKIHKHEVLLQRYIITKGNLSSKFRVVFRNEQVRVYRVTNRARFDKKAYEDEEKSEEVPDFVQNNLGEKVEGKKDKARIFKRLSFASNKEGKLYRLDEFMESVEVCVVGEDLKVMYGELAKFNEKIVTEESEVNVEDSVSAKILSRLQKMFCTYSKEAKYTRITQFKNLSNFTKMIEGFVALKDIINKNLLLQQNKKISVFMCDFFEDSQKNVFFSQIKYCKCVESLHVPLKVKQKIHNLKKNFKCPGKYCSQSHLYNQVEVFAKSILIPSKKVFPKKCKILVGTIDENYETNDNMQKLNPRLFERTQVCKNCFIMYSQQLSNKKNNESDNKVKKDLKKVEKIELKDFFNLNETQNNIKKKITYMDKLGTRTFSYTNAKIIANLELPKVIKKKQRSFLDLRKKMINDNIKIDEFVEDLPMFGVL